MATIFCFSSTGNSLFTAKSLAKKIYGKVKPMNRGPELCDADVIGFVFPVYFWGLPRIVERFVSQLQISKKDAYVFAVATCGGQVYSVPGKIARLLAPKGIPLRYGGTIHSVSNYIPEYTPKDSSELRQRIDKSIDEIAAAVNARQSNRIKGYTLVNKIAYRFYPKEDSDRYFAVAPVCTGCGTCQKVCPVKNIEMRGGKPAFLHKCEHCLACLQNCPAQAIDWKGKTQGKVRYRNASITLHELISFNALEDA